MTYKEDIQQSATFLLDHVIGRLAEPTPTMIGFTALFQHKVCHIARSHKKDVSQVDKDLTTVYNDLIETKLEPEL